ncbi:general secretion pathway protein GspK [Amphritea sp. HPY]|uniref:general secretion pathway protein GspK n=1 Tax=Amphritea sp. HPY TaxID=3421652 RepID=UPI003D7DC26D
MLSFSCAPGCNLRLSRGIALISVLWVVLLLSLMAAAISATSRSSGQLTNNLRHATQAKYAAEAGVQWAYWGLDIPADQVSWLADGSVHEMPLADMLIQVAVEDENGKIDLNSAPDTMLRLLLIAADVDDARADSLADAILDWRDGDDLKRLNGAEDDDYLLAGLDWEAKDAPFESILELRRVLGMDEQVFSVIRDSVTVYSGKQVVNPLVASRWVLLALSEASEAQVEQYIDDRRRLHPEGEKPSGELFASSFFSTSMRSVNYTIHTQAVIDPQTRSGMSVVVQRRGGQGKGVFKILDFHSRRIEIFGQTEL